MLCRFQILLLCATLTLTAQAPTPPATTSSDCRSPRLDTRNFLKATAVRVWTPHRQLELVAVTAEATRARGLMCVIRVPPDRGMIFVFAPPERLQSFWMKNTLVPLDMVFVGADGRVSSVAADVPATPNGTPDKAVATRQGAGQFVLELGAGEAARHGIVRGTKLTLPALTAEE
jgi:uncharacterized membrane protein (UPF0127 family)